MTLRRRTFEILEPAAPGDTASRVFDVALIGLITLNVAALVVESVQGLSPGFRRALSALELASVVVFSVEYVLRIWSCTVLPEFRSPVLGRLRYALRPMLLVDLLAVLPFYLPFLGVDLRFLRAARIMRVFRLAKLARYSVALQSIGGAFRSRKEELVITFSILVLLLFVVSTLMYFAEHDAQPQLFRDIPSTLWWGIATLTTVGYGDLVPVTAAGKLLGALVAVLGIAMFALPTSVLGAAFLEQLTRRRSGPRRCPHCGAELPS